jgi:hypothetical protein
MAIAKSALVNTGASFIPSPTNATLRAAFIASTIFTLFQVSSLHNSFNTYWKLASLASDHSHL